MICNYDKLSFQTVTCARFTHDNGIFCVEGRPYAALSLRTKGRAEFVCGESAFVSLPGDVMFLPEGQSYTVKYEDSESIVLHFFQCNYNVSENIKTDQFSYFLSLFEEILEGQSKDRAGNWIKSKCFSILQMLAEVTTQKIDADFLRCISFAKENFSAPNLQISDLCKVANMSASGLYRCFYAYYGMSAKQYLLQLRMKRATELLVANHHSVKEVARLCGFSDEKYFSRMFKKHFGLSPSRFFAENTLE